MENDLPLVSVCVITYDRLPILQKTVSDFLERCTYPRDKLQLILCDDGSPQPVQDEMRKLPFDKFLFAKTNEGLGKNTNKGIKLADGQYILQLQDDWLLSGSENFIEKALEVFDEFPKIGMVRYESLYSNPYKIKQLHNGEPIWVLQDDLELIKKSQDYASYTDRPHIKRKEFHQQLGYYREGVPMTKMEIDFVWRVAKQTDIKIAYIPGLNVFEHIGIDHSYNPGVKRTLLREKLLKNIFTKYPFRFYLSMKHQIIPSLYASLKKYVVKA